MEDIFPFKLCNRQVGTELSELSLRLPRVTAIYQSQLDSVLFFLDFFS